MWLFNIFNTPLDNFAIELKAICTDLDIDMSKDYKITQEDMDQIEILLVERTRKQALPFRKWMVWFFHNSISTLVWHNARDAVYQIHMDIARQQFGVDVRESTHKIEKDNKILTKHFGY